MVNEIPVSVERRVAPPEERVAVVVRRGVGLGIARVPLRLGDRRMHMLDHDLREVAQAVELEAQGLPRVVDVHMRAGREGVPA